MRVHAILLLNVNAVDWPTSDQDQLQKTRDQLQNAKDDCIKDLENAKKTRRKARPQDIDRWKELAEAPLVFLQSVFTGAKFATQLSKILQNSSNADCISIYDARTSLVALATGGEMGKNVLQVMGKEHWVMWAPTHNEALQRLLNTFTDYCKEKGTGPTITLIIPFHKPMAGDTFEEISDTWSQACLQKKLLQKNGTRSSNNSSSSQIQWAW